MKQINRRTFIRNTAALAAGVSLASCRNKLATTTNKSVKRPNILFVFPDQFRRQAMGFMGADPVITPNIDRFASQGLVFTNACSNYPLCSPFRGMLMTGKYPYSNHLLTNCCSAHTKYGVYLRESERCLSDVLYDAGYSAGYIGKWHLDALDAPDAPDVGDWRDAVWDAYTPPGPGRHGFEFWYSYGCMDKHLNPHYWINNTSEKEKTVVHEWSPRHEANVAIDFIRNENKQYRIPDKPFALFVAMNLPHPPFDRVPSEYLEPYEGKTPRNLLNRKNVDFSIDEGNTARAKKWIHHDFAAVTGVDEQFGRILRCLADEELAEDTIVVFTADHGEMMGSHNRMGKSTWYEESFGIPFIIRWSGHISSGREDMLLSVPDFIPSLLGLASLSGMIPACVEGVNYSNVMLGKSALKADSALYLAPGLEKDDIGGLRGVRTRRFFLGVKRLKEREQYTLFDLEKDPYQLHNIADDEAGQVEQLKSILGYWLDKTSDPWGYV